MPAQTIGRCRNVLDFVRNNQFEVWRILMHINSATKITRARAMRIFSEMHKQDQDVLLVQGGILTDAQIEILSPFSVSYSEPETIE